VVAAYLDVQEKVAERGKHWPPSAFIVGGERGATVVLHAGVKAPEAC
jgi:hypothetical protein